MSHSPWRQSHAGYKLNILSQSLNFFRCLDLCKLTKALVYQSEGYGYSTLDSSSLCDGPWPLQRGME